MQKRGDVKRKREPALLHTVSTLALSVIATRCQLSQRERANPLRRSRASSPEGGASFALTNRWQKAPPEWNDFPPVGGKIAKPERGTAGECREPERVLPAARLFPQEISAADAVFLHDPTRENAMPGGPQTARHCSIINSSSAEYAQSSAERIPIVFLRTAPQPPDAPAKHTAMPRRTGSPP